jgi:hypothetical protein
MSTQFLRASEGFSERVVFIRTRFLGVMSARLMVACPS